MNVFENDFKIGGIAIGGAIISTMVSTQTMIQQVIIRSEKHKTGVQLSIIGDCFKHKILLFDDVSTSGNSIINAVNEIRKNGGTCNNCIVVLDREEGAMEKCNENGIGLYALTTKSDFIIE